MDTLFGIFLKILSTIAFTLMLVCIKYVPEGVPVTEIIFARSIFAMIPILLFMAWQRELKTALVVKRPAMHLLRAVVGSVGMFCWFAALRLLPLPEATAIGYLAPMITVIFAVIFLQETVRLYRWMAVFAGFAGIFVILVPRIGALGTGQIDAQTLGAILAVTATFGIAGAVTCVRILIQTESTASVVFYFAAFTSIITLMTAPFGWVMPTPMEAFLLVSCGLLGGIAQLLLTTSYRYAETSVIAPFDYLAMIWSVIAGYFLFSEYPSSAVIFGAVIVIAAGLFIIYRESNLGISRNKERSVDRAASP